MKAGKRVDQAFSIWYHHPRLFDYLWLREAIHTISLERRYKDERKRIPRNIDTRHEGMELHRGCPGT